MACGEHHPGLPMSFAADAPAPYYWLPEEERAARVDLTPDVCVIDGGEFYVRGVLEIPILGTEELFVWGVWASLSEQSYRRTLELWDDEGRENEPPYFGWLCTDLPVYLDTLSLKTLVHERPVGARPFVELEPTDHPLAVEQREGITPDRAREISHTVMHPDTP